MSNLKQRYAKKVASSMASELDPKSRAAAQLKNANQRHHLSQGSGVIPASELKRVPRHDAGADQSAKRTDYQMKTKKSDVREGKRGAAFGSEISKTTWEE